MGRFQTLSTGMIRGLHQDENPHAIEDGELAEAFNICHWDNMIGTRPGVVRPGTGEDYENAIAETNAIQGAFEYRKDFAEGRRLVLLAEHSSAAGTGAGGTAGCRVFYEDAGLLPAGAPPQLTAGVDNIWTFAEHNNVLYAAGGDATDDIWTWDGNIANPPTVRALTDKGSTDRLRPKFIYGWRNYVLMNGLRSASTPTASDNPAVTRYATFGADPTLDASWVDGNTIGYNAARTGVDSYGTSYSTGFGQYVDNNGQWLLLLHNNHLISCQLDLTNDFAVTDAIANGCVSQRAFVSLGLDSGDAVYLSRNGFHSLRQSQEHGARDDKFLSFKIQEFFRTVNRTRLQYAVGAYDFLHGRVVFALPTGSNLTNDTIVVLDLNEEEELNSKTARWMLWKLQGGLNVQDLKMVRDSTAADNWHLYAFTDAGDVIRFSDEVFTDLGSSYETRMLTAHRAIGGIDKSKVLGDVHVTLRPGGAQRPSMRFYFDYGARISSVRRLNMRGLTGGLFGTAVLGVDRFGAASVVTDDKVYGTGRFRTLAFEISHSTGGEPWRIGKIDYQVSGAGEDTGDVAAA